MRPRQAEMNPYVLRSYLWFRSQGEGAATALAHARAERHVSDAGLSFAWQDDTAGWDDLRVDGYLCSCEGCFLIDADGRADYRFALWGIWDADDAYRRIIEADLALEYIRAEVKNTAQRIPQL